MRSVQPRPYPCHRGQTKLCWPVLPEQWATETACVGANCCQAIKPNPGEWLWRIKCEIVKCISGRSAMSCHLNLTRWRTAAESRSGKSEKEWGRVVHRHIIHMFEAFIDFSYHPHHHSDSISPTPFSACSQLLVVVGPVHPSIPLNAQYFFDFATDACHTENSRFPSSLTLVFWHSAPCSSPVLHPEIPNPRRKLWASSSSSNAALNSFTLLYISHSVFNARETFFGKYRTWRRIYLWKRFIKMCLFYLYMIKKLLSEPRVIFKMI